MNVLARNGLALLLLLQLVARCPGQEWTRFRGPNGTGISDAKTIPAQWTEQDYNWKIPLPGPGHSSPVLWGDKIFLTTGDEGTNQVWVMCLSAGQGRAVWQRSFPVSPCRRNANNNVASSSPAVDAQRVYVCWAVPERNELMALDHAGNKVWEKDLGPYASQHGSGASPIVYHDQVIIANEQDGESYLIAVAAATGETRWKTPRKGGMASYSTPCVFQTKEGKPELVFASHEHGIYGMGAEDGKVRWELAEAFDKRVVSSPVIAAGLIIGQCGSGGGGNSVVAVRPGEAGANRKAELTYAIRKAAPYVPTGICVGSLLFLWGDDGVVSCVQAASGEVKWQERLGKHFFSSPVCVDSRLFCVSTIGEVTVIGASDRYQLLGRNSLGETTHSTPAVAGGRMYIHTLKHLISVGGGPGRGKE